MDSIPKYIRIRTTRTEVTYEHPLLEKYWMLHMAASYTRNR